MAGVVDIANLVAQEAGITKVLAKELVNTVLNSIDQLVIEGNSVIVQDFGTFKLKTKAARNCLHPKTGEPVMIPSKTVLSFKAARK